LREERHPRRLNRSPASRYSNAHRIRVGAAQAATRNRAVIAKFRRSGVFADRGLRRSYPVTAGRRRSRPGGRPRRFAPYNQTPRPQGRGFEGHGLFKPETDQNVMLQRSMRPVSAPALSFTRSFHWPFSASLVRSNTKVPVTLSVLPPVR